MVDIRRDFPETIDEKLVRVEDREGAPAVSDSGVSSWSSLLPYVPERLRRDRALFTERKDDGYRSTIAEPVSRSEPTFPRQMQASQGSRQRDEERPKFEIIPAGRP